MRMTRTKIYIEYLIYLIKHKYWVFQMLFEKGLYVQAIMHDISKFYPSEFDLYARYYATKKRMNITKAWHLHLHRNKHHWQYWIFMDNEGNMQALEMPEKYAVEMIADWYAVAIVEGGMDKVPERVARWYYERAGKILLHQNTKRFVEDNIRVTPDV